MISEMLRVRYTIQEEAEEARRVNFGADSGIRRLMEVGDRPALSLDPNEGFLDFAE